MRDRGSMMVLVMFVSVGIVAALTAAMMPMFGDLIDRQQARSAADAAALAGVTGGRPAASALAVSNDAVLVGWSVDGRTVTVQVRLGDQVATARATDEP